MRRLKSSRLTSY